MDGRRGVEVLGLMGGVRVPSVSMSCSDGACWVGNWKNGCSADIVNGW